MTPPVPICDTGALQLMKEYLKCCLMRLPTFLRTQMITIFFVCVLADTYLEAEYKFCSQN